MIITESDLIGYKFGRYTVIGRGNANNTKDERWLCKCDCGTERIIKRRDLVSGRSTSCGCGRRQHSPKDAAISSVFAAYKGGAKQRGIEFSLDKDVFAKLLLAECTYCGTVGGCVYNDKSPNHTSEWRQKKVLTYTGIDRIDSSKGYTVDNCCSCCLTCNKAKNTMSQEEFSLWVLRVLDWAQKVQESKEVKKHAKREIEDE